MSIVANVSLNLSCVAHGPPEPVRVIWLQDGAPLNSLKDAMALSPSTLNLTGIVCRPLLTEQSRPQSAQFNVTYVKTRSLNQVLMGHLSVGRGGVISCNRNEFSFQYYSIKYHVAVSSCGPK